MSQTSALPSRLERCVAAFLGLAIGDAYGRPLEFMGGDEVRRSAVDVRRGDSNWSLKSWSGALALPPFRWTDDTHMALYLARAVQSCALAFDDDAFGRAVGEAFIAWAEDPLMPFTAPGNTCLAGVSAYRHGRDWRTSGVATSDGCGAVMRIAPLAMAYSNSVLTRAADISSRVTHAHPNAREAAIAASHILAWVLDGSSLDATLLHRAVAHLDSAHPESWSRGGDVARSLVTALDLAIDTTSQWLDDARVWPGDGGWRSGSALGLALAAALRWQSDARLAIDRAARIDGDSDSVACLTGMFLGATGGLAALPPHLVAATMAREEIEEVALACGRLHDGA
ncbi:MAG: ADP-ribosylglycohydrolase family protein [Polyangiaceae bacterium]